MEILLLFSCLRVVSKMLFPVVQVLYRQHGTYMEKCEGVGGAENKHGNIDDGRTTRPGWTCPVACSVLTERCCGDKERLPNLHQGKKSH